MNIFAHFYNANIQRHGGKIEAVLNTKGMPNQLLKCLVHDFERAAATVSKSILGKPTPVSANGTIIVTSAIGA